MADIRLLSKEERRTAYARLRMAATVDADSARRMLATIDAWQELSEAQADLLASYRLNDLGRSRRAVARVTAAKAALGLR